MKQFLNLKNNFFYIFIFVYFFTGVFLSLNVGITHDEYHDLIVWELKKKEFFNIIFKENYDVSFLGSGGKYYGIGFHLLSLPIEIIVKFFLSFFSDFKNSSNLISKHVSVFIFFLVSGIFFQKIILLVTKNEKYSKACTVLYLLYPYLLGHSFFNIKDVPFLSLWLICTYYISKILISFFDTKKIYASDSFILGLLTAFLLSIRISGVLILIQYIIFFLITINISNFNVLNFIKKFKKQISYFLLTLILTFYILHPVYWFDPLAVIEAIKYMSAHVQTVCTITLGDCMKAQDLPSTYIPIWLFFKLPILILFGLFILPITEKKIFNNSQNSLIIGSLIITLAIIIFILIIFNVNLYDELRQIMFTVPLFFLVSLSSIYFFSKKFSYQLILIMTFFFIFQNLKIFPYNYVWLNNFTLFTKVNKNFELDYWGVSTKEIANYFNKKNLGSEVCIISNRNDGIKAFMREEICFLSFDKMHSKNKRPFYIALTERSLNKGLPNNCRNIYNEEIKINFSKENILLAKVFRCD